MDLGRAEVGMYDVNTSNFVVAVGVYDTTQLKETSTGEC